MTQVEYDTVDTAINEYIAYGFVFAKCPRCGRRLVYKESAGSYGIVCPTESCVSEWFLGI